MTVGIAKYETDSIPGRARRFVRPVGQAVSNYGSVSGRNVLPLRESEAASGTGLEGDALEHGGWRDETLDSDATAETSSGVPISEEVARSYNVAVVSTLAAAEWKKLSVKK